MDFFLLPHNELCCPPFTVLSLLILFHCQGKFSYVLEKRVSVSYLWSFVLDHFYGSLDHFDWVSLSQFLVINESLDSQEVSSVV